MKFYICDDYIQTDAVDINRFKLTLTPAGMALLPYGHAQKWNEIDVICENGYITNKIVIELFRARGLMNTEITTTGPLCMNGTLFYMILAPMNYEQVEEPVR